MRRGGGQEEKTLFWALTGMLHGDDTHANTLIKKRNLRHLVGSIGPMPLPSLTSLGLCFPSILELEFKTYISFEKITDNFIIT